MVSRERWYREANERELARLTRDMLQDPSAENWIRGRSLYERLGRLGDFYRLMGQLSKKDLLALPKDLLPTFECLYRWLGVRSVAWAGGPRPEYMEDVGTQGWYTPDGERHRQRMFELDRPQPWRLDQILRVAGQSNSGRSDWTDAGSHGTEATIRLQSYDPPPESMHSQDTAGPGYEGTKFYIFLKAPLLWADPLLRWLNS